MNDWPMPKPPPYPADDEGRATPAEELRPVWLTRADREFLAIKPETHRYAITWDAAPADPVEAVRKAFIDGEINSDYHGDVVGVEAVLVALGYPR